ncbi:Lipoteichoic acid synthase [compost metagenome]
MHSPGGNLPAVMSNTGGQIDILPTIANLLGLSVEDQLHFGQDLFNQDSNVLPIRHFLPAGSFVNDQSIYVTGNDYADGDSYSLNDNRISLNGATEGQFMAAQRLLEMSNSYLLQLPDDANQ